MFEKAEYLMPNFQGFISLVLVDIEMKGEVFWIALGPVTIYMPIGTIELLSILQYRVIF